MMCTSNVCLCHRSRRYVVFCNSIVVVITDGIVPKCLSVPMLQHATSPQETEPG